MFRFTGSHIFHSFIGIQRPRAVLTGASLGILLLCGLALTGTRSEASPANLDSLYSIWSDETVDIKTRVQAMQRYAWFGFLYDDPDSAYAIAEASFEMAKSAGLVKYMGWARLGQGVTFEMRGDNPKALRYYLIALDFFDECGDKAGIAGSLNNIGIMYTELGEYELAEEYHEKSLALRLEVNDRKGISASYENLGKVKEELGEYEAAIRLYRKSLRLKIELEFLPGQVTSYADIAIAQSKLGQLDSAEFNLIRSVKMARNLGEKFHITTSLIKLGELYILMDRLKGAQVQCKEGLELARQITNRDQQFKACDCLYQAYKSDDKHYQALEYLEMADRLRDSLQEKELMMGMRAMEFNNQLLRDSLVQSEKDLKNKIAFDEEVRKKTRNRNVLLVVLISTLVLTIGFVSRLSFIRKSNKRLEKEKNRSDELLLNILPHEVAEELKQTGISEARDFTNVTVLFTDFQEFTATAVKMTAKELVSEVNICFRAFDEIIERHGIEKIKTIGDAYMAAGGLHGPDTADPATTVLAGLDMQAFVNRRKEEMSKLGRVYFEMRAGIHTGPVVAGIVGVKKFQYDLWGDTVNTASRMESHSDVGKVNISNTTYLQVKDDPRFTFEKRGTTEVKGKGEMTMWFVSPRD